MRVADYIAGFLARRGVQHVFDLSGGYIAHLIDAIHRNGAPQIISLHHEQAGAFAADGVGRTTGEPGVAMATAGPGATNLLTGIASCYFDSSPAVFITGNVNPWERTGDHPIRQLGFQETDIASIVRPVTKAAWEVEAPEQVPELLARAFNTAVEGRPGPVLIDFPLSVQYADIGERDLQGSQARSKAEPPDGAVVADVLDRLEGAKRPLIWAGGGIRAARATELLREFSRLAQIPVACSLMGLDALPATDPLRVGFIGAYGNRWANLTAARADVMLVLGARLDVRQTGSEAEAFRGDRTIIHVDCEAGEINNRVTGCEAVHADVAEFLSAALSHVAEGEGRRDWLGEIDQLRRMHPDDAEPKGPISINPNRFMHQLSRASDRAGAYVVDVGQHQMWAAQSLDLNAEQSFVTSGGLGSMGFALPAAIGVALCAPPKPVVVVAGDGGFQCNIQELQSVVRHALPLKIVVIDNGCHGMTRQFQGDHFGERYQSSLWGYSAPDFVAIARAYGIGARSVDTPEEIDAALEWLWQDPTAPVLLRVGLEAFTNLYPKIAFGRPITEMEPIADPLADWDAPDGA